MGLNLSENCNNKREGLPIHGTIIDTEAQTLAICLWVRETVKLEMNRMRE